jgi:hypothetical protein
MDHDSSSSRRQGETVRSFSDDDSLSRRHVLCADSHGLVCRSNDERLASNDGYR